MVRIGRIIVIRKAEAVPRIEPADVRVKPILSTTDIDGRMIPADILPGHGRAPFQSGPWRFILVRRRSFCIKPIEWKTRRYLEVREAPPGTREGRRCNSSAHARPN